MPILLALKLHGQIMIKNSPLKFLGLGGLLLSCSATVNADDEIKQQVLKLFPQADTNGDDVISDAEEAVVWRQALKRRPKIDKDGDGVLSDAEKQRLLRTAAKRAKQKPANPTPASAQTSAPGKTTKTPSFANVKYGEHERQIFDIWLVG